MSAPDPSKLAHRDQRFVGFLQRREQRRGHGPPLQWQLLDRGGSPLNHMLGAASKPETPIVKLSNLRRQADNISQK